MESLEHPAYFEYGETEMNHLIKRDKKLGAVITRVGKINRLVNTDVFSSLVESIIGQQISAKAADTVCRKLRGLCGTDAGKLSVMSVGEIQSCGMSMRKAGYVKGVADAAASNAVNFEALRDMSDGDVIKALTNLKGVGVWTAEMLLIFSLLRPDIVSYGDLAIRRSIMRLYNLKELSADRFDRYKKRYSPYGSVASLYLWYISALEIAEITELSSGC